MRPVLFAIALLSIFGFSGAASAACTTVEHVSATKAEHVLKAEECLWTSDTRYVLFMHKDGTLDLTDKRFPGHPVLWEANIEQPQPGSTAVLQNDGNFVVKDPTGKELWRAPSKTSGEKTDYFLALGKKGKLELYKGVTLQDPNHMLVWASEDNQASDRNGECQCHITNSDGSPGKASGEDFSVCGLMVCRSTCAAKKDYFGDALIGTYKHGSGKCKAF
ncbi:hypothetical protein [Dongia sedimenti]|uniref:Bulb-type lectin domain-containing protein n=1 Tax=Dongia sedimenti TaxID=3064282 RepID=A0ABU0YH45_9PROT|nr:hypothetical protein [Rhodospirillaceae bacterium R-7]